MSENTLPKAWQSLLSSYSFLPVIVKTIERVHEPKWSMEQPNHHDNYEMVYIKRGMAVFEIGDQPVPIGANDIIIIKPGQPHRFSVDSDNGCEFIVLNFKFQNSIDGHFSQVPIGDFLNFVTGKESGSFIKLKVSQKNEIVILMNRILKERQSNEIGNDLLECLMVMELFVLISRALKMEWENNIKTRSPKVKELIQVAVNYINNNYERDISLGDIAHFVFLSPSYFTRAFKEEVGMSPINYLLKTRIERAKELLKETQMKVSDIALGVGFANQQRFNEIFKKYTGITPLHYRKQGQ